MYGVVRSSLVEILGAWAMDIEYAGRVLARLKPFVRDRTIRRTRLERVLGTQRMPADELRPEVERLLRMAGIAIEEDRDAPIVVPAQVAAPVDVAVDAGDGQRPLDLSPDQQQEMVAAARRRITADRRTTNPAKVLLRAEEEVGLSILIRGAGGQSLAPGDFGRLTGEPRKAAESLLLHNQGLVHSIAQRYSRPGMGYDDLFQHGIIGLIRAVELFDPHLGYKFSTYATHWIRQSITRGIANEARLIRLPVHVLERVSKVWATRARLTVDGDPPGLHQLALACEMNEAQVLECLLLGPQDVVSLDTPVSAGETTLGDLLDLADPNQDPYGELLERLRREQIDAVLDTLSYREADIIRRRFGLDGQEPMTLDQIGTAYGLTRERIRQIERKTLDKLSHESRSGVLRPFF